MLNQNRTYYSEKEAIYMELSAGKIFLILILAFILFGAKKLPEFGSSAGKALFEFKKAIKNITEDSVESPPSKKVD